MTRAPVTSSSTPTAIEDAPFVTERLLLRLPEPADATAIAALADANPGSAQIDIADARAWIARARLTPGARTVAIVERRTGAYLGAAGMAPMGDHPDRLEVGLWIGAPHARRGFATETAHALIDHVFDRGLADRLWTVCRVSNTAGRRVIEKSGFQHRENGMARSIALRGAIPVDRFVLERRTWLGLKSWGATMAATGRAGYAA